MLQNDYSGKILEIQDIVIKDVISTTEELTISFSKKRKQTHCPVCGTLTDKVHDYRTQKVTDIGFMGKRLKWLYRKRRYVCPHCQKRFYETEELLPKYHRITSRSAAYAISLLSKNRSMKDIANQLGVSASTVIRWLKLISFSKPKHLPEAISIDEFKGDASGERFQFIYADARKRKVLDVLPSRKQEDLCAYFGSYSDRRAVKYVVMDMNKAYKETMRTLFPNADLIIDKFHVVRQSNWAFENVRKRIQKELPAYKRKYFKRSRKLLLARMDKLKDKGKEAVSVMLTHSVELTNAYMLKEYFYDFIDSKNLEEAQQNLAHFRRMAAIANIPEYKNCLKMLRNWEPYILNAFKYHYTNGFIEGVNNSIKVLKRNAFGFRNFSNFRRRILLKHA